MKKKSILICSKYLGVGGIETALINMLKEFDYEKYEISLLLMNKEGEFLKDLPQEVKLKDFQYLRYEKNATLFKKVLFKIVNKIKVEIYKIKYRKKFDFSISYSPYIKACSEIALAASEKNAIWGHSNYYDFFCGDRKKLDKYLKKNKYFKFKNICFVSKVALDKSLGEYRDLLEKSIVINNIIQGDKIIEKSKENVVDIKRNKDITVFINVSRHEEKTKKISKIIEASKILKEKKRIFELWLVGDGENTKEYKKMVKDMGLENYVKFLGRKSNPYKYIRLSDCLIVSSKIEGASVVVYEGMVLNKYIISTDIADVKEEIEKYKYGAVCKNMSTEAIIYEMEEYIENSKYYEKKAEFDFKKMNEISMQRIYNLILGE